MPRNCSRNSAYSRSTRDSSALAIRFPKHELRFLLGVLLDLVADALGRDDGALQLGLGGLQLGDLLVLALELLAQRLLLADQLLVLERDPLEELAHLLAVVAAGGALELHVLDVERAESHLPPSLGVGQRNSAVPTRTQVAPSSTATS
ncbi:MAG: hypothetical protein P8Z81_15630 [Deinococcales bacterium]